MRAIAGFETGGCLGRVFLGGLAGAALIIDIGGKYLLASPLASLLPALLPQRLLEVADFDFLVCCLTAT